MSDSLAGRVAARRQERVAKRASKFVLPIPGYTDLLAARYKPLEYEEKREIQMRHDGIGEDAADEVAASADLLINACVELLEITGRDDAGEPTYKSLGKRWNADIIRELFGVSLPEKPTARQALVEALGSDDVMGHFGQYAKEADKILADGEAAAAGEAKPSVEG